MGDSGSRRLRAASRAGLLVVAIALSPASAEDALPASSAPSELLERAFHNLYADDYVQTMVLATRSRSGRVMERRLQITRKQSAEPGKALVRFLDPYQIRHTSILVLENEGATDDLYVYLPAARRTRHLSASQRADSFFGTDLSYEDVEPKHARDYRVQPEGTGELDGAPCSLLVIEARPHFESTYERMRSCIEPRRGLIYWTEFFRKGAVVKRLTIDPDSVREIGTRHIPFTMTMETPRRRSQTRIVTERYELSGEIPDTLFSTWNLEAGDADQDRRRAAVSDAGDGDDAPSPPPPGVAAGSQ